MSSKKTLTQVQSKDELHESCIEAYWEVNPKEHLENQNGNYKGSSLLSEQFAVAPPAQSKVLSCSPHIELKPSKAS